MVTPGDSGSLTRGGRAAVQRDLFVYLSGPITAAYGYSVKDNVAAGLRVFFACVARGIPAYSPYASVALQSARDIPWAQWLAVDYAVIDRCTHVLMLPRWETSAGAVAERAYATQIGKPILTSLEELEGAG